MHGLAGRRAPVEEGLCQLRDGRPLAAPEVGRELGLLRLDAREGARRAQAGQPCRAAGSRSRCSTTAIPSSSRRESGKKADWFTTHGDVFPVGTSKMKPFAPTSPERLAELPLEAAEQGAQRVEPLLRPGHQRRGPALGQRRGSLGRQRLRPPRRLSLPGVRRLAGRVHPDPDQGASVTKRRRADVAAGPRSKLKVVLTRRISGPPGSRSTRQSPDCSRAGSDSRRARHRSGSSGTEPPG